MAFKLKALRDWLRKSERADALRRLGGEDLDAERKKNAMSGEQKAWVMGVMTGAILIGWVVWNFAQYHMSQAALQPSAAEMLACVNQCATACAAQAEAQ